MLPLGSFIRGNLERIMSDWETFARSLPPGKSMSRHELRDDAERVLRFEAIDQALTESVSGIAVNLRHAFFAALAVKDDTRASGAERPSNHPLALGMSRQEVRDTRSHRAIPRRATQHPAA